MNGKERIARPGKAFAVCCFALHLTLVAPAAPASALDLTEPQAALYTTVSIFPPDATKMTACYGFVCRRRQILDFTASDRAALAKLLAAGRASAAAERAAVQKAVIWFDHRMGPILGTDKRVAKADFRYFDAPHNYDCWDTTRNTTSLLRSRRRPGLGYLQPCRSSRNTSNPGQLTMARRSTSIRTWLG